MPWTLVQREVENALAQVPTVQQASLLLGLRSFDACRLDSNTAKESVENKKLTEQDYMRLVDQAWMMPRAHTGLRLMCHEGILEMTGNRGGECGFLRLEQMRLADTSQLALHPAGFERWLGNNSNIVRSVTP